MVREKSLTSCVNGDAEFYATLPKCYMECVLLGTNTFPLSTRIQPLEVVIIPTAQASCWNMLEQLRGRAGKFFQYPLNQTANHVVSSEYNPFIFQCPLVKCLKYAPERVRTHQGVEIGWESLFNLCASLCGMALYACANHHSQLT